MALASSLSSLSCLSISSASCSVASSPSQQRKKSFISPLPSNSLVTTPLVARKVVTEERNVVVRAAAEVVVATEPVAEAPPADGISTLLSEKELLKRKAKRAELRRKRLVRKRKLRKKGKWPPSKMAKLKNV
ncbi:unnamed protein product [Sphagnum tenellum]